MPNASVSSNNSVGKTAYDVFSDSFSHIYLKLVLIEGFFFQKTFFFNYTFLVVIIYMYICSIIKRVVISK